MGGTPAEGLIVSRLINPGAGEITDRLTILALKILFGKAKGRPVESFQAEQTALLAKVRSRTLNGVWFEQVLELAAVNAALWHAEDELRVVRQRWQDRDPCEVPCLDAQQGLVVAFRIQKLNDRRAQLVTMINANAGDASGEEKLT